MILRAFFFLLAGISSSAFSQGTAPLDRLISERMEHLTEFYRDLHANPELSGEEKMTAAKVAKELHLLGLEVAENIGGLGVVGILRNGKGPTSFVRADTDALPVNEETNVSYKSRIPGKMHACGHDFHTAALVGTAFVMTKSKAAWKGTLVFVAQPAEEINKGAKAMVEDAWFKKLAKPDQILALHTAGNLKKGQISVVPGYTLANVDGVDVEFKGRGTHGAIPESGIDPFIQAAEFTLKLQTLLGREKAAGEPAVISVGSIHGGTRRNIIPPEVKMQLTVRTFDPELRRLLQKRIREVAFGIARTAGAPEPVVQIHEESDATYNDPALAIRLTKLLKENLGADTVVNGKPSMAGEDFGNFGRAAKAPSFYFMVGERDERDPKVTNHSPKFAPDFTRTAPLAVKAMSLALGSLHAIAGSVDR